MKNIYTFEINFILNKIFIYFFNTIIKIVYNRISIEIISIHTNEGNFKNEFKIPKLILKK